MIFFEKSKTIFFTLADTLECFLQDDACIAIDISPKNVIQMHFKTGVAGLFLINSGL